MGYVGISNMLAVEFDTYYNPELLEPFENHVTVQTRYGRYEVRQDPHGNREGFLVRSKPCHRYPPRPLVVDQVEKRAWATCSTCLGL